jgi:hypothetical protein
MTPKEYSICTQSLTTQKRGICFIAGVFILFVGEILHLILRLAGKGLSRKKEDVMDQVISHV